MLHFSLAIPTRGRRHHALVIILVKEIFLPERQAASRGPAERFSARALVAQMTWFALKTKPKIFF